MTAPAPVVVAPVFKERLWGGSTLREWYGDLVPDGVIGECWAVSGMPGDAGEICSGPGLGRNLAQAWRDGLITGLPRADDFPILIKLLDPADWLSVQVHPDDAQAWALEGQPRGKSECWYVVACQPGAELIIGHTAATAEQLRAALDRGTLDSQLLRQPVHAGSFSMVPAGCLHAIGPGMLIYEVQQSSDITYRLYDFDRIDRDGRPRTLHVDKGFAVVTAPHDPAASATAQQPVRQPGAVVRTLVESPHFTVQELRVTASCAVGSSDRFEAFTVLAGNGELVWSGGSLPVTRGTSVVLPVGCRASIAGDVLVITSRPAPSPLA